VAAIQVRIIMANTEGNRPKLSREMRDALGNFTPDGIAEVNRLLDLDKKTKHSELVARYDQGAIVAKMMDDENQYGKRLIPNLSVVLRYAESDLYILHRVPRNWSKKDFKEIIAREGKDGFRITWKHFAALVQVDNERRRNSLLNLIFKRGWSAKEVVEHIADDRGGKTSQGGRPPERPKDVKSGLTQLTSKVEPINKRYEIWEVDVLDKIIDMPGDDYDPTLLRKAKEAQQTVMDARGSLEILGDKLDTVVKQVSKFVEIEDEDPDDNVDEPDEAPVAVNGEPNGEANGFRTRSKGTQPKGTKRVKKKTKKKAKKKVAV
jgi:hypothetical protein